MKKAIRILILMSCWAPLCSRAANPRDSLDTQKQYFQDAKLALEAMLNGQVPLSFERAVFLIENAYHGNMLDYAAFEEKLDDHQHNIETVMNSYRNGFQDASYKPDLLQRAQLSPEDRAINVRNLYANWAVFTYMHDPVLSVKLQGERVRIFNQPFRYSYTDPLGTTNWQTTQVTHLLQSREGNCFALAALYKIFADRLHTDAQLTTAPGHIYITHKDEIGRTYNVELSNGAFPGSGTMGALTYTTNAAIENDIALRELDTRQSVALCLVYLAKGYQYRFGVAGDDFMQQCAASALQYDPKNLNAMLLAAELLERRIMAKKTFVSQLQTDKDFEAYQRLLSQLYDLGYREMPLDMKNKLIRGWTRDSATILIEKNYNQPAVNHAGVANTRYASLTWGAMDEEIRFKPVEQYGCTLFDVKKKKIILFTEKPLLYNNYTFDPVAFAWNVDPLAHKFPWQSPYAAMDNNPILKSDPTGASGVARIKGNIIEIHETDFYFGRGVTPELAKADAQTVMDTWNAANAVKTINGKTYNVRFVIDAKVINDPGKGDAAAAKNNDVEKNYIAVGRSQFETTETSVNQTSDGTDKGGNEFEYNQLDFATDNKSSAHEHGHGWGWFDKVMHKIDPNVDAGHNRSKNPDGSYNLMQQRTGIPAGEDGNRKATQEDVDKLNINWQELGDKGKTNVGEDYQPQPNSTGGQ